jgi:hypothetical protein
MLSAAEWGKAETKKIKAPEKGKLFIAKSLEPSSIP